MSPESTNFWNISRIKGTPPAELVHQIQHLADAAVNHDGNPPFSEQTLVELKSINADPQSLTVLLATAPAGEKTDLSGQRLAGAAVVLLDAEGNSLLELAVHPEQRRQGVATALVEELKDQLGTVKAWSHGHQPGAEKLAQRYGFEVVRELWRLKRPNGLHPLPEISHPEGVALRTFVPGQDEQAWLAANAAAFAHHPEQGAMTLSDLQARMAEDWFDPKGFFLAVDSSGEILGFHWTKVHAATAEQPSMGEVYVVGVTPAAQGKGLGKLLTVAGLEYLENAGPAETMLYVDADNTAAVKLYERLGFTRWEADLMYAAATVRS